MKTAGMLVTATLLVAMATAPALAQFQAQKGGAAWTDEAMTMAGIQREPEIEKAAVLNFTVDRSRDDHVALADALPDAIVAHLVDQKLVKEAKRHNHRLKLGDYGLPEFDSPEEARKLGDSTKTDGLVCGDIGLVGDATRVRVVVAEIDELLFYPPINVYITDPTETQQVAQLVCRALQSFMKAEDLQKELEDTWQEPDEGKLRFEARPNLRAIPEGEASTLFVRLEFAAGKFETEERSPLNVAIVLDRSGSMEGEKLEQAKQAAVRIVEGLEPTDRLSFVIYDDEIKTLIPNTTCTKPKKIIETIRRIASGGSTNLGGGLQEGFEQAREALDQEFVNRVILLSDGLANEGETRAEVLADWARKQYARDLSTSTVGIGTDYDAKLMEKIAVAGNGGYYYVETPESINDIIAHEFSSLFATVAEGTSLSLRLAKGVKLESIYGFEVEEKDGAHVVDVPTLRSSDRKFLIAKLSVPALDKGAHELATATVDYSDAIDGGKAASLETPVKVDVGGSTGAEVVDWRVQIDAEELETAEVMDQIVALLEKDDKEAAVGLVHGRILELARMSLQTMDLRSQVQCNILDGLVTLIRQGDSPDGLTYALNNAQSIAYGGLGANVNYQGLGQQRGAMAAPGMAAGGMGGGGFGGKRQQ